MNEAVAKTELLIYHTKRGDVDAVKALIDGGANVNARTSDSSPMLSVAVGVHSADIVELLVEGGADVNASCYSGQTPLGLAVTFGFTDLCKILLAAGADPCGQCGRRSPPLVVAVNNRSEEIVDLLIGAGADVNAVDSSGYGPLLSAVHLSDFEMCKKLVEAGAGPARDFTPDDEESIYLSPYQLAMRMGWSEIAWLLFERFDEDPFQATTRGVTMEALVANTRDTRELLLSMKTAHALRLGSGTEPRSQSARRMQSGPAL
jgi:ankyrin repeat protein